MQRTISVLCVALFFVFSPIHAQEPSSDAPDEATLSPQQKEVRAAWQAAAAVLLRGPSEVSLKDQGKLQLPEGYGFIAAKEGTRLMTSMGSHTDDRFIGLIVPLSEANWIVTMDFEPAGYIKDDDAKVWKADEMLDNLKEGTEAGNKRRESMGIEPIVVTRWIEPPSYESSTHRLVWSAELKSKHGEDPDPTINYNTYVLGREGYISMDLITATSAVTTDKLAAKELLSAVKFNDGKQYGDFNSSTDKVAAYGLAALVGGIAAKKLGLLAVIGVFLAKFAKVIFIGLVAAGGVFAKFFKKKQNNTPQ
jgi:uncharacterized membrane-anchored protein